MVADVGTWWMNAMTVFVMELGIQTEIFIK
jgi:hypothetical protein